MLSVTPTKAFSTTPSIASSKPSSWLTLKVKSPALGTKNCPDTTAAASLKFPAAGNGKLPPARPRLASPKSSRSITAALPDAVAEPPAINCLGCGKVRNNAAAGIKIDGENSSLDQCGRQQSPATLRKITASGLSFVPIRIKFLIRGIKVQISGH